MLEVISVLSLLTAPAEVPTVTDLLEEKEQELVQQVEEHTEQVQQELVQQIEEEQEQRREEEERQAEQARAEEARQAAAREEAARTKQDEAPQPQGSYSKWEPIARCESGYGGPPQWSLDTGNGFYGGLQFTLESWRWVGGEGYPHHASKEEQIYRAEILLERQGWKAWPACSEKVGYR